MEGLDDLCIAEMGQANEVARAGAPGPRAGACSLHVQSSATYLHTFTYAHSRFAYVYPNATAHFEAHTTPLPTPTITSIPSSTPTAPSAPPLTPTAAPSSTPPPRPTLTDEQAAAAHLSQLIPWLGTPPDELHRQAAESIVSLWLQDAVLGDSVARMAWLGDGLTDDEGEALDSLRKLAADALELARLMLRLPWVADISGEGPGSPEWSLFKLLLVIAQDNPDLGLC